MFFLFINESLFTRRQDIHFPPYLASDDTIEQPVPELPALIQ